jgi:CRISPR/Cas system CMR-associated protein Cmr5 small subunit
MAAILDKTIAFVREKGDNDYQDYHSQRLVDMTTLTIIGYLMLRDATKSERKKDVLKYFLEFAVHNVKKYSEIIMSDTKTLLEKKEAIIDGLN